MSAYEELRQFVAIIAGEAQDSALNLVNCADSIEKCTGTFNYLTATTQGNSAKNCRGSF